MERETFTIDAADQVLGRLATKVAVLLRGKHHPGFLLHVDKGAIVLVKNAQHMKITGNKLVQKKYYRHSGYLGGIKEKPLGKVMEKNPTEALRKAVWGMLPKNRLRAEQIKRLKIEA